MMKVKITRGVLYNREPLKVGTVIELQDGIAAAFISQNQAELVGKISSKDEGENTKSKSKEEEGEGKTAKRGRKAKKK